jgi:aryl-alcohol dehydrogenase-like predicted oxidoreductase
VTQSKLLKQYSFENTGIFAWSPNGQYFATGSYANQPATDQSTADQVAIIDAQSGQYIASCGPSSVKVWTAP